MSPKQLLIISFSLFCLSISASPQLPDYLIFEGDTVPVYYLLLEQYLVQNGIEDQGSLFGLKFREGATSFNCWRGYQAIYTIDNDSLFLLDIIDCWELNDDGEIDRDKSKGKLRDIFGEEVVNDRVYIEWYSGNIGIPSGNLLRWDGVFFRLFEKERVIKIRDGKIQSVKDVSNYIDTQKGIDRRYGDTVSNVLFEELKKVKWKDIEKFDCSEQYYITIGKDGKVSHVSMATYQTKEEIKEAWDGNEYNYCIRTISKALKDLKFDIIKREGEPIEEQVYLEIWLEDDGTLENWTN